MTIHPVEKVALSEEDSLRTVGTRPTGRIVAPYTETMNDPPMFWRFRVKPNDDPRSPEFSRAIPKSEVANTEEEVDAWLDAGAIINDEIQELGDQALARGAQPGFNEDKIWIGEADISKKWTVQRGATIFWFLGRLGPEVAPTIPESLRVMFQRLAKLYASSITSEKVAEMHRPMPAETNAGYPLFTAGPAAKICSAALYGLGDDWDDVWSTSVAFNGQAGLPTASTQSFGIASRSGPLWKFQPEWTYLGLGRWKATREVRGAWQRNRQVFMGPATNNIMLRELWARMMAFHKSTPGLAHQGDDDDLIVLEAYRKGWYVYESDFSGFDQSVSREMQRSVRDALRLAWPDLDKQIEAWYQWEASPVVTPSWDQPSPGEGRGITIVGAFGGTHSGMITTSVVGTFINLAVTLWALERIGYFPDAIKAWRTGLFSMLCLGDDMLLCVPSQIDQDRWKETISETGLTATVFPGCRFLMLHRTPNGPKQVAARTVQGTMSPEYQTAGKHAIGMNALGFAGRTQKGVWPTVGQMVWPILGKAAWIKQTRVRSINGLRRYIADNMQDVIAAALSDRAAQSVGERLMRDAPYSQSAAQALEVFRQFNPDLLEGIEALRNQLERYVQRVIRLPRTERLDIARRMLDLSTQPGMDPDMRWAATTQLMESQYHA